MTPGELTELYRRYAPWVHARARRMVGDEAGDVLHDLMVRLMEAKTPPANPTAWMYTTCTNLCLDRLRHRARRDDAWQAKLHAWLTTVTGAPSPQALADRELCRKLWRRMDKRTQEIAAMVFFDEMTHDEVAATLGVSRKTVSERLARLAERGRKWARRW